MHDGEAEVERNKQNMSKFYRFASLLPGIGQSGKAKLRGWLTTGTVVVQFAPHAGQVNFQEMTRSTLRSTENVEPVSRGSPSVPTKEPEMFCPHWKVQSLLPYASLVAHAPEKDRNTRFNKAFVLERNVLQNLRVDWCRVQDQTSHLDRLP